MSAMAIEKKRKKKEVVLVGKANIIRWADKAQLVQQPYLLDGKGKRRNWKYVEMAPSVRIIIPFEDSVLLTYEFRKEYGDYVVRVPGGKVFDTLSSYLAFVRRKGNMLRAASRAAIKESNEEVGIIIPPDALEHFSISKPEATVRRELYYFVAGQFTFDPRGQHLTENEDIEVVRFSFAEAAEMCKNGQISEDQSALALWRWLELNKKI